MGPVVGTATRPTHAGAVAALLRYGWRLVVRVTMHAGERRGHIEMMAQCQEVMGDG